MTLTPNEAARVLADEVLRRVIAGEQLPVWTHAERDALIAARAALRAAPAPDVQGVAVAWRDRDEEAGEWNYTDNPAWAAKYPGKYQPLYATPPQPAGAVDDAAIFRAARVLSDRAADACGINRVDNWNLYAETAIDDARAALEAARIGGGEAECAVDDAMYEAAWSAYFSTPGSIGGSQEAVRAALVAAFRVATLPPKPRYCDAGHTLEWCARDLSDAVTAYCRTTNGNDARWMAEAARRVDAKLAAAPSPTPGVEIVSCEDCDGSGRSGNVHPGSMHQPPEAEACPSCEGSGKWRVQAEPTPPVEASNETLGDKLRDVKRMLAVEASGREDFRQWWLRNVPAGTVISSPEWWIPRIARFLATPPVTTDEAMEWEASSDDEPIGCDCVGCRAERGDHDDATPSDEPKGNGNG